MRVPCERPALPADHRRTEDRPPRGRGDPFLEGRELPTPRRGFGLWASEQSDPTRVARGHGPVPALPLGAGKAGHPEIRAHASVCGESPTSLLAAFRGKMRASRCLFLLPSRIKGRRGLARITIQITRNDVRNKEKFYFLGKYRAATSGSMSVRSSR